MITTKLPTWTQCSKKPDKKLTTLEQFILEHEPFNNTTAEEWREQLRKAIDESTQNHINESIANKVLKYCY